MCQLHRRQENHITSSPILLKVSLHQNYRRESQEKAQKCSINYRPKIAASTTQSFLFKLSEREHCPQYHQQVLSQLTYNLGFEPNLGLFRAVYSIDNDCDEINRQQGQCTQFSPAHIHFIGLILLTGGLLMRTTTSSILALAVVALVVCTIAPNDVAAGEVDQNTLKQVKDASEEEGCDAIPYSDLKRDCKSKQQKKTSICQGYSCDPKAAKKLKTDVNKTAKAINDFEDTDQDENTYSKELRKKLSRIEDEFEEMQDEAKSRLKKGEACLEARENVQEVFEDVTNKLKSDKSKYNNDELDDFIDKLIKHFDEEAKSHDDPMDEVSNACENCEDVIALRL